MFLLVAAIDCEAVRLEGFVEAKHVTEFLTTTCLHCVSSEDDDNDSV